jgi:hypothetical protein
MKPGDTISRETWPGNKSSVVYEGRVLALHGAFVWFKPQRCRLAFSDGEWTSCQDHEPETWNVKEFLQVPANRR